MIESFTEIALCCCLVFVWKPRCGHRHLKKGAQRIPSVSPLEVQYQQISLSVREIGFDVSIMLLITRQIEILIASQYALPIQPFMQGYRGRGEMPTRTGH